MERSDSPDSFNKIKLRSILDVDNSRVRFEECVSTVRRNVINVDGSGSLYSGESTNEEKKEIVLEENYNTGSRNVVRRNVINLKQKENTDVPIDSIHLPIPQADEDKGTTTSVVDGIDEVSRYGSLTENAYSLIYISDACCISFYFGLFFSMFQLLFPILALVNAVEKKPNVFNVPVNVSKEVFTAGVLCIFISVPTFTDLLDAIEHFQNGYNKELALKQASGATYLKWLLAFSLQLLVGGVFNLVIFILIVQSTTIIEMFLNFAALQFITDIDDLAFSMAKRGYFPNVVGRTCNKVTKHKTPKLKTQRFRRLCLIFFYIFFLSWYVYIHYYQHKGKYQCKRLRVQLTDSYIHKLPLFSGFYKMVDVIVDSRHVFVDENSDIGQLAYFRYCQKEKAFVFNILDEPYNDNNLTKIIESNDICEVSDQANYMQSAETQGYDIMETNPSDWMIRKNSFTNYFYPVDYFALTCADCTPETCNGVCGGENKNECICMNHYGVFCEFNNGPCDSIQINTDTPKFDSHNIPFDNRTTHTVSSSFKMLRTSDGNIAYFYAKPMYGYDHQDGYMDFLFYSGRRYYLVDLKHTDSGMPNSTDNLTKIADLVSSGVDITDTTPWNSSHPYYMSAPIDIDTPSDRIDPIGLNWYKVDKNYADYSNWEQGIQIDTVLACADCVDFPGHGFLCPHDYSKCTADNVCESFYE